jgi:hypothetical protein
MSVGRLVRIVFLVAGETEASERGVQPAPIEENLDAVEERATRVHRVDSAWR